MIVPQSPQDEWLNIPALLSQLEAAGISNAAVAKQLGVCRSSVHKWKRGGVIKLNHWQQLIKIIELLPDRKPLDIETAL